jgi:hypothetical protein
MRRKVHRKPHDERRRSDPRQALQAIRVEIKDTGWVVGGMRINHPKNNCVQFSTVTANSLSKST